MTSARKQAVPAATGTFGVFGGVEVAGARTFWVFGGVEVAGERILGLVDGLVEDAEVGPGGRVTLVELHGADVRLQRVHRLVLLLVENPGNTVTHKSMPTMHMKQHCTWTREQ